MVGHLLSLSATQSNPMGWIPKFVFSLSVLAGRGARLRHYAAEHENESSMPAAAAISLIEEKNKNSRM